MTDSVFFHVFVVCSGTVLGLMALVAIGVL